MKKTLLTSLLIIITILSCNETEESVTDIIEDSQSYSREVLLTNWYTHSIQPRLSEFKNKLDVMVEASQTFVNNRSLSSLDDLRSKYIDAYISWQRVEMINIGKAEEIYYNSKMNIYPVNTNRINSNITSGTYDLNNANNNAAQGFPTIDYLLFGIDVSNTAIIEKYSDEKYQKYLTDITANMQLITAQVVNSWETYKNDFISSTGNTATSSMNVMVNDFLFYYEKGFRANKIGIPAGVFSTTSIPENVEAYYSRIYSKRLALEAYEGIIEFYEGKGHDGKYYDGENLKSVIANLDENTGDNNLANKISDKMKVAYEKIGELDDDFVNQISTDPLKLLSTYDAIQEVVVLFKVDMLQILSINVDYVDADGD